MHVLFSASLMWRSGEFSTWSFIVFLMIFVMYREYIIIFFMMIHVCFVMLMTSMIYVELSMLNEIN